jgi:hypothetical protein
MNTQIKANDLQKKVIGYLETLCWRQILSESPKP